MTGSNPTYIGVSSTPGGLSEPLIIDELFFVGEALTQSAIEDIYRLSKSYSLEITTYATLVQYLMPDGYWKFNDSGTKAIDSAFHGHDASFVGTMTKEVTGLLGNDADTAVYLHDGGAIRLYDGISVDYHRTGNNITWTEFSFHGIVNFSILSTDVYLYSERTNGAGNGVIQIYIDVSNSNKLTIINSGNTFVSDTEFAIGTTYHIVYIADKPDRTLIVNGVEDTASDAGWTLAMDVSQGLRTGVGCFYNGTAPVDGTLDEFAFYSYALTATNAADLYTLSQVGYTPPIPLDVTTTRRPINYGHIVITDENTTLKTMELTIGADSVIGTSSNKPVLIHLTAFQSNDNGTVANIFAELESNWDKLYIKDTDTTNLKLYMEYWNETENIVRVWAIIPSLTTAEKVLSLEYHSAAAVNPITNLLEMVGTTNT